METITDVSSYVDMLLRWSQDGIMIKLKSSAHEIAYMWLT